MRRLTVLLTCLAVAAIALASWGFSNARADPIVRRATVELPDWPGGALQVTVALLSDIHIGNRTMDAERLTRIVGKVNALRPDMVLIAGDFISGHHAGSAAEIAPLLIAPLSRLKPRLDWWTGSGAVRAALTEAGITVLDNAAVRVGPLAIGGIGDRMTHHDRAVSTIADMRRVGGAPVVLTHGPDVVRVLPQGVPLVLAGHTHCGQGVVLGRPLSREPYLRRYRCDIIRDGGRATIVTGGLGTSVVPFRIGAPPDLWLLTLRARS